MAAHIPLALAHHNWNVDFDAEADTEIEGVISSIAWVNPHVRFKVVVDEGADQETTWDCACLISNGYGSSIKISAYLQRLLIRNLRVKVTQLNDTSR